MYALLYAFLYFNVAYTLIHTTRSLWRISSKRLSVSICAINASSHYGIPEFIPQFMVMFHFYKLCMHYLRSIIYRGLFISLRDPEWTSWVDLTLDSDSNAIHIEDKASCETFYLFFFWSTSCTSTTIHDGLKYHRDIEILSTRNVSYHRKRNVCYMYLHM